MPKGKHLSSTGSSVNRLSTNCGFVITGNTRKVCKMKYRIHSRKCEACSKKSYDSYDVHYGSVLVADISKKIHQFNE